MLKCEALSRQPQYLDLKNEATDWLRKMMTLARFSISTLPKTNSKFAPRNRPRAQKERIISHQFSVDALVSGREFIIVFLRLSALLFVRWPGHRFWKGLDEWASREGSLAWQERWILRHSSHICVPFFCICNIIICHMGVSLNGGTQQPWVFLLKMIILGCLGGTTI